MDKLGLTAGAFPYHRSVKPNVAAVKTYSVSSFRPEFGSEMQDLFDKIVCDLDKQARR